jgi:hypothetical protein
LQGDRVKLLKALGLPNKRFVNRQLLAAKPVGQDAEPQGGPLMSENREDQDRAQDQDRVDGAAGANTPSPQPAGTRPRTARQTASADELDKRISFTATLLSQLKPKGQIKATLKQRYGCSARTCETYLACAREKLLEWTGKSREEMRVDVVGLLSGALRGSNKVSEKMLIVDRIIAIYGLEAPKGLEIGNQNGTPFKVFQGFDPDTEL